MQSNARRTTSWHTSRCWAASRTSTPYCPPRIGSPPPSEDARGLALRNPRGPDELLLFAAVSRRPGYELDLLVALRLDQVHNIKKETGVVTRFKGSPVAMRPTPQVRLRPPSPCGPARS